MLKKNIIRPKMYNFFCRLKIFLFFIKKNQFFNIIFFPCNFLLKILSKILNYLLKQLINKLGLLKNFK